MLLQHLAHIRGLLKLALRPDLTHRERTDAIEHALQSTETAQGEANEIIAIMDTYEEGLSLMIEDENLYPPISMHDVDDAEADDLVVVGPTGETWTLDELLAREG